MPYKTVISMVAAVVAIGCAAGSQAATAPRDAYASETVSVRVKLADLNLASLAGSAASLRRIHNAAKEICGVEPNFTDFELRRIYRGCVDNAVNNAVDRLASPIVSTLNNGSRSAVMAANVH